MSGRRLQDLGELLVGDPRDPGRTQLAGFLHAGEVRTRDRAHQLVTDAHRLARLHDRGEHVDADAEPGGDDVAVAVVARVGAQLRHARLGVADRGRAPLPRPERREHGGERNDGERRAPAGDAGQARPQRRQVSAAPLHPRAITGIEAYVGDQHRQQHQVGQNDDRDADARGNRHLANHRHRNHENGDETHQVREQRNDRRCQQLPERAARALHAAQARERGVAHGADLLHTVTDADREHQERHQQADGVDAVTQQHQRAQLPDHRYR